MPPELPQFNDPALLERALTHASSSGESGASSNERLEFLGDAVLALVAAERLYRVHPELAEGQLSAQKAWVVSREVLAVAARELALGERARLGHGLARAELSTAVLANLYEALLGAVYLDRGLEAARDFVEHTLGARLDPAQRLAARNEKQELQELVQRLHGRPPDYVLVNEEGPPHARSFQVAARIGDRAFAPAWGRTRKEAERGAAQAALLALAAEGIRP